MQGVFLPRERARELCSLLLIKSADYVNSGLHVAEVDPRGHSSLACGTVVLCRL